jgi:hypothetical protein
MSAIKQMTRLLVGGIFALSVLANANQTSTSKSASSNCGGAGGSQAAVAPQPSVIRVEPVGPIHLESDKPTSSSIWLPIVSPIFSGLLALLGAWIGLKISQQNTLKTIEGAITSNQATLWQKANEGELRSIQEKLDKFYGPLMTRLQADHILAQDIRSRQPPGYRLLKSLFDRQWLASLSAGDRKLVDVICEHAGKLEEMIIDAGSIDPVLIPYFSRAVAHFRILRLAHEGILGTDPERFKQYVYPKPLDAMLMLEIERLDARVNALRAKPDAPLGPMPRLVVPDEEKYRLERWVDPDGRVIQ